jgi:hypothetical protein
MIRKRESPTFAVCVDNTGYRASLETGKLYQVIPDSEAKSHGLLRVIDESGEEYGYSANRFFALPVPSALGALLMSKPQIRPNGRKPSAAKRVRAKKTVKK